MAGEEFVVPGAGAGAGEGGGAEAPPADEVVDGEVPAGTEGGEGGEGGGEPADPAPDADAQPDAELASIETDGRKLEGKVRETAAKIAKIDKQAAKEFRENHYRTQAFMKEVPGAKTPGEAISTIRNMRATIDELGGEQGITEMRGEVDDYRTEIKQFGDGDPALVKTLGEANPEGLARQGANTLEWLRTNKPDLFADALRPSFMQHFEKEGWGNFLSQMEGLVKEGKGQEAWDLLQGAKSWVATEKGKLDKSKEQATAKNPEADKLAKDREEFETQKKNEFIQRVDADVNRLNNPALDELINPLQKQLGLQKPGMQHFRNGLIQRVWSVLAKDPAYIKQVRAVRGKGDAAATANYIHEAFKEKLTEQFRLHRNEIYPSVAAKAAPKAAAAPANGKKVTPVNVAPGARPKADQVDWTKTSDTMWATGKAYLTDGKFVQGFKDAPPNRY